MSRLKEIKIRAKSEPRVAQEEVCYHPEILNLEIKQVEIIAFLNDGRKTSIPIDGFIKGGHKDIKPKQLKKYEIGDGKTIFGPDIDAHVGVEVFTDGLKGICPNCH